MFSHKPENFEASEAKRYGKNNRSKTVEYKYEAYDVAVIGILEKLQCAVLQVLNLDILLKT